MYDKEYMGNSIINRDKITAGINNGQVTRGMLEAMIEDDDLSKKDMEWIKLVLNNDKFAKTKTDKAIKVTHGLTADEPGSGPKVTKPPISTFKIPPIAKGFKPTTQAEAKANADFPDVPEDVEETRQAMDLEKQKGIVIDRELKGIQKEYD